MICTSRKHGPACWLALDKNCLLNCLRLPLIGPSLKKAWAWRARLRGRPAIIFDEAEGETARTFVPLRRQIRPGRQQRPPGPQPTPRCLLPRPHTFSHGNPPPASHFPTQRIQPAPLLAIMEDDGQREANERNIVRTWRAWRTVHEMVSDRVSQTCSPSLSAAENNAKTMRTNNRATNLATTRSTSRLRISDVVSPTPREVLREYLPPPTLSTWM